MPALQLESSADDEHVEGELSFQLEEMIKMARDEMGVVDQMAEWKPWESEVRRMLHATADLRPAAHPAPCVQHASLI